jgi:uncharacterized membrane protein
MIKRRIDLPEEPRVEPEIIPPQRGEMGREEWYSGQGNQRVYVTRLGPWSVLGIVLLFSLVAGAVFALLLGALLIAIPVIGFLVAAAVIAGILRGHFRH